MKWKCSYCGYVYDEDEGDPLSGIPPGTKFEDLPDDWKCPICGAPKDMFYPLLDMSRKELKEFLKKWRKMSQEERKKFVEGLR